MLEYSQLTIWLLLLFLCVFTLCVTHFVLQLCSYLFIFAAFIQYIKCVFLLVKTSLIQSNTQCLCVVCFRECKKTVYFSRPFIIDLITMFSNESFYFFICIYYFLTKETLYYHKPTFTIKHIHITCIYVHSILTQIIYMMISIIIIIFAIILLHVTSMFCS